MQYGMAMLLTTRLLNFGMHAVQYCNTRVHVYVHVYTHVYKKTKVHMDSTEVQ